MEIKGLCPIRADRRVGFVIVCYKDKKEGDWYHINTLKKLIKFINKLQKKRISFKIYKCSSGNEMDREMVRRIKNVGKIDRRKLYLDDN